MKENETRKATVIEFKGDHPLKFESIKFGNITIKCPNSHCTVHEQTGSVTAYCGESINAATGEILTEREIEQVRWSNLTEIKAWNGDKEVNFPEVVSIVFEYEHGGRLTVQNWNLRNFQYITDVPTVSKITVAQYEAIANYVRQKDKEQNFKNAIENQIAEPEYSNLVSFLESNLSTFAETFDEVTDYTGEDEWNKFQEIIRKNGGSAKYLFVSNKGTDDEIEQEVVMMKPDAEHLMEDVREANNGCERPEEGICTVIDITGDTVDLAFVDEITIIEDNAF